MIYSSDNFKYRLIEGRESLPENISIVRSPSLEFALAEMFTLLASDHNLNFIVWNPPVPLMGDAQREKLKQHRLRTPFDASGRSRQSGDETKLSLRYTFDTEFVESDADEATTTAALDSIFDQRLHQVFGIATRVAETQNIPIAPVAYQIYANNKNLAHVRAYDPYTFHADASRNTFLRLLYPAMGPGTYVLGSEDATYTANRGGSIQGRLANGEATIWMLRPGSVALMRSGGKLGVHPVPAVHCIPFQNAHYPEADAPRILERCDFECKR